MSGRRTSEANLNSSRRRRTDAEQSTKEKFAQKGVAKNNSVGSNMMESLLVGKKQQTLALPKVAGLGQSHRDALGFRESQRN